MLYSSDDTTPARKVLSDSQLHMVSTHTPTDKKRRADLCTPIHSKLSSSDSQLHRYGIGSSSDILF